MTGPQLTAVLAVAAVIVMQIVVVLQPRRVWQETAEHSKIFWLVWSLGSVAIGAVPAAVRGWGWGEAAWLAVWCGCAALQPAMIVDVVEVRRQVRRRRAVTLELRRRRATGAGPSPIRWRVDE
jgi:uncharacterized membrane protein YgcG